jgi:beta-xylosidase
MPAARSRSTPDAEDFMLNGHSRVNLSSVPERRDVIAGAAVVRPQKRFGLKRASGGFVADTSFARAAFLVGTVALTALPMTASHPSALPGPQYSNPILYADYSDPDVIRVKKDYYLVASTFHFSPGLPVLHSRDLVHWSIIGHVLPTLPFAPEYDMPGPIALTDATDSPTSGTRYGGGIWAPAIRFHAGKFYVYFPTPNEGIFMATAVNPAGPWSKPVSVLPGANLEDPCPFWDDDGSAWVVHSVLGAGPLILHRMNPEGTRVLDKGEVIVRDPLNLSTLEGPKIYKRNGWYYIFAPFGGVSTGAQVVLRSRTIRGPYDQRVVLRQGSTAVQGPHQGGWVETPSGEGWFVHFNSTGAFGRITYLEPLRWVDDWPVIGDPIAGDTAGQPITRHPVPDIAAALPRERLQDSDDFTIRNLGPQWEWNHNPDNSRWSLTKRPGFLRLTAGAAPSLIAARNTLTQVLQGPSSRMTVRIDATRMTDGQRAGLSLFGARPSWIGLVHDGGTTRITLANAGVEAPGAILPKPVVYLRAAVNQQQMVRYSYSVDGQYFSPLGDAVALAPFSWWKGSRPAIFTFTRGKAGGSIDIDWFRVDHP